MLPEGEDPRVVSAAGSLLSRGLCDLVILGDETEINSIAENLQVDLTGAKIMDPKLDTTDEMVSALYEARKHKGECSSRLNRGND